MYIFPKGISAIWNANSLVRGWTLVAMSISYNNIYYMISASIKNDLYISLCIYFYYFYFFQLVRDTLEDEQLRPREKGIFSDIPI